MSEPSMTSASWIVRAERALAGGSVGPEDVVMATHRPPLLDGEGAKAVVAPVLAALAWGAAIFREMVAQSSLDPVGMLLRLIAVGMTLRVLVLGATWLPRFRIWLRAHRYGLVLTPEGLLFRTPTHDVAVPRQSVVSVTTSAPGPNEKRGRRWADVYAVIDPSFGRTHVALPPIFEDSPALLAGRLKGWRGPQAEPREVTAEPAPLASRVYDEAVAGMVEPGTVVVYHDLGWLKKAPYAVLIVGVVAFDSILRGGAQMFEAMEPWMIGGLVLAFLAIPARWLFMTRREVSPRRGLTMVLTPAELLIRTKQGILRSRWRDIARVSVDSKTAWSVLEGAHQERQVVITRAHATTIRYDEPYMGLPAEVSKALLNAYRFGRLPRSAAPTSTTPG